MKDLMMKRKKYGKNTIRWCVYENSFNDKNLIISYSESIFGKYAKELARRTCITGKKFKNYYDIGNEYIVMKIYSLKDDEYYDILIDIEDYVNVSKKRWSIITQAKSKKGNRKLYVGHVWNKDDGTVGHIRLHQFILGRHTELVIDHKNGNGLDNRRSNLRHVTLAENNLNKQKNNFLLDMNVFNQNFIYYDKLNNMVIIKFRNKLGEKCYRYFNVTLDRDLYKTYKEAYKFYIKKHKGEKRSVLHIRKKKNK